MRTLCSGRRHIMGHDGVGLSGANISHTIIIMMAGRRSAMCGHDAAGE
jgi:hypothetical protein